MGFSPIRVALWTSWVVFFQNPGAYRLREGTSMVAVAERYCLTSSRGLDEMIVNASHWPARSSRAHVSGCIHVMEK